MSFTPPSNPSSATPGNACKKLPGSDTVSQHAAGDHTQDSVKNGAQVGSQDQAQRAKNLKWLARYMPFVTRFPVPVPTPDTEPGRTSPGGKCSKEDITAVLDVCEDDQACDTVMVCYILEDIFGNFSKCAFSKEDIAEVVKARYAPRHSFLEAKHIYTVFKCLWCLPRLDMDMFGARRREERWLKVYGDYRRSEKERDEIDEEEMDGANEEMDQGNEEMDKADEGMDEADEGDTEESDDELDEADKELNCACAIWTEAQKTLADSRKNKL